LNLKLLVSNQQCIWKKHLIDAIEKIIKRYNLDVISTVCTNPMEGCLWQTYGVPKPYKNIRLILEPSD